MTEFRIEVVRIGEMTKHPNADQLSIVNVHGGYPCIVRTQDFSPGDLAVYIPVDALVDGDRPEFAFLGDGKKHRIRARKLRGVFSMGLLIPSKAGQKLGEDVQAYFGIEKYLPPTEKEPQQQAKSKSIWSRVTSWFAPRRPKTPYYDIEGLRRSATAFREGEKVWITEKIHGCNARFVHTGFMGRLHVGSRTVWRGEDPNCKWWKAASKFELTKKLREVPHVTLFGEIYGPDCQDLDYGVRRGDVGFLAFDAYDVKKDRWLLPYETRRLCYAFDIPMVPVLYSGPWSNDLRGLCEGKTTLDAKHVREGIVIRSEVEDRKLLKLIGEGYMLRG